MAKIKSVKLLINHIDHNNLRKVRVNIRFTFTEAERGKKFQFNVSVRPAEILHGDPGVETPSPQVLYWFKFDNGSTTKKTITAGEQSSSYVYNDVDPSVLNEDPSNHPTGPSGGSAPDRDEVFVSVALMTAGAPHVLTLDEKRSNVVTLDGPGPGV